MKYSEGFAAPIVWGATQMYTTVEIALGLEIPVRVVEAVLEEQLPGLSFPKRTRPAATVRLPDPYMPWLKADKHQSRSRRYPSYAGAELNPSPGDVW